MKAVPQHKTAAPAHAAPFETLEHRRLMVYWPGFVGLEQVATQYPWLDGGGGGVAVIDKGVDYYHPRLGGNQTTGTKAPKVVNVFDYNDNDTDPFPTRFANGTIDYAAGHGTGVTGLLIMPREPNNPAEPGVMYQGVLQDAKVYNLRTSNSDSQGSIAKALQWVVDNHAQYGITAINLTDFVGTSAALPLYDPQLKKLWDAGIFIITPVANDWLGSDTVPGKQPIGYPAKSPYIFGSGGLDDEGDGLRPETQRGVGLDILAPARNVWLPYFAPGTTSTNGTHEWVRGTGNSWGAPMVLGTAVLLRQIDPTLKPAEIMQIIQDGGVYVADTAANAQYTGIAGYKRLDALGAVRLAYQVRDDASDQNAGNDTRETAATIALDSSGKGSLAGRKLLIHDPDFYKFTTSAAGTYDLSTLAGAQLMNASGAVIGTVGATGTLRQSLAAGTYYVHLYDADKSLSGTYSVAVNKLSEPPAALSATFAATPHVITLSFSKDVGASLAASDLVVTPTSPSGAARSPASVTYDAITNTARFTFATPLPDGNYRATITAANVTDASGQPLSANFAADFYTFTGDLNRDRAVNFDDLLILASNYNKTSVSYAQGDLDSNGAVNFDDLLILAGKYNKTLPAPTPALASPTIATVTAATLRDADDTGQHTAPPLFATSRITKPAPKPKPKPSRR